MSDVKGREAPLTTEEWICGMCVGTGRYGFRDDDVCQACNGSGLLPKIRRRPITRSRSLGFNTSTGNEVRWMPGTFAAGVYEVWCRGDRIAIVTDRWMADMIHSGLP